VSTDINTTGVPSGTRFPEPSPEQPALDSMTATNAAMARLDIDLNAAFLHFRRRPYC
jgi:hypothetical protein